MQAYSYVQSCILIAYLCSLHLTLCTHVLHNIAAEKNGNRILKTYHNGAYGSLQPDEWSCCKRKGREQTGCICTTDDKPIPDSTGERLRERRFSPPEPIPRSRGGVWFKFNTTIIIVQSWYAIPQNRYN